MEQRSLTNNAKVDPEDQILKIDEGGAGEGKEENAANSSEKKNSPLVSNTAVGVLALLACQNSFKNLLMRFVMTEKPEFLLSTAVLVVEALKLFFSTAYVVVYEKQSIGSIFKFIFTVDRNNSLLLFIPASCYILQMTLEYVAFANIDAATFSVLVQTKMLFTAVFFWTVLGKKLMKKQMLSLVILTVGVMLCNMKVGVNEEQIDGKRIKGISATVGIAISSGFASVYTEKVIKKARKNNKSTEKKQYGLAYMQCQLAVVSLFILGMYAMIMDSKKILEKGLFQNFNGLALCSCMNSAVGGLIVAGVLKYANSVLKGYATAVSVVITGVFSAQLFGTHLSVLFGMGMINVVISVLLYNLGGLDDFLC